MINLLKRIFTESKEALDDYKSFADKTSSDIEKTIDDYKGLKKRYDKHKNGVEFRNSLKSDLYYSKEYSYNQKSRYYQYMKKYKRTGDEKFLRFAEESKENSLMLNKKHLSLKEKFEKSKENSKFWKP